MGKEITALQKKILNISSKYIKRGGTLVYSTCTIEKEENEEIIKAFLNENRNFESVDISGELPDSLQKSTAKDGYIQLYPNIDRVDGFFISKIRRKA